MACAICYGNGKVTMPIDDENPIFGSAVIEDPCTRCCGSGFDPGNYEVTEEG